MVACQRTPLVFALRHIGAGHPVDTVDAPRACHAFFACELNARGHTLVVYDGVCRIGRFGYGITQTVDDPSAVIVLDRLRAMATGTIDHIKCARIS